MSRELLHPFLVHAGHVLTTVACLAVRFQPEWPAGAPQSPGTVLSQLRAIGREARRVTSEFRRFRDFIRPQHWAGRTGWREGGGG